MLIIVRAQRVKGSIRYSKLIMVELDNHVTLFQLNVAAIQQASA